MTVLVKLSFGKNFVMFMKKTELLFTSLGRSVLGKIMPSVLSTARGRRLRAVLKTSGIVFPNTDRPRRANNIYMCTWNRTESYWPCEVHVYWSACFFNWKTKIQRITIPLPWYLWFIGFRLTTTLKKNKEQKLTIPLRAYQSDIE